MREVRCDRCGAVIEKCPEMRIQVQLIRERIGSCYQSNRLDLCQKCEDEVWGFIFNRKKKKNVEQAKS